MRQDDHGQDDIAQWQAFLEAYSQGQSPTKAPPIGDGFNSSMQTISCPQELQELFDAPVYNSLNISRDVAVRVRDFYQRYGFLPPPREPREELRDQVTQEYDLYSSVQKENMQSTTKLVQRFFGGLVTFTVFRGRFQILMGLAGGAGSLEDSELVTGTRKLHETSLCGHAVLFADQVSCYTDMENDWRFTGNPYVTRGYTTYTGSLVKLAVDPTSRDTTDDMVIGSINIMKRKTDGPSGFDQDQQDVLLQLTRMLQTQLRATWEGATRTRAARARRAISDFIDRTLRPFDLDGHGQEPELGKDARRASIGSTGYDSAGFKGRDVLIGHAQSLAEDIQTVMTDARTVMLVDLRAFHATKTVDGDLNYGFNKDATTSPVPLGWTCPDSGLDRSQFQSSEEGQQALKDFLRDYSSSSSPRDSYDRNNTSGLEHILPGNPNSHIAIPFMAGDQPIFCFIITSEVPYHIFRADDVNFVHAMGVVLRAQILQARVVEADAAKTAFLSSISHELRTPMHGLLSGLQLVAETLSGKENEPLATLLDGVASSGQALECILNDLLDFGNLSQRDNAEKEVTDIAAVARETMQMSLSAASVGGGKGNVELILESESRDWRVTIDRAGLQRILFNGFSNAIKYTDQGRVVARMRTADDEKTVVISIEDTGIGIPAEFFSQLFQAFKKADAFTPGTGLGLHISRGLAERMGGSIEVTSVKGQGTTFTVRLPVDFLVKDVHSPDVGEQTRTESFEPVAYRPFTARTNSLFGQNRTATSKPGVLEMAKGTTDSEEQSSVTHSRTTSPNRNFSTGFTASPDPDVTSSPSREPARVLVVDDNEIGRRILLAILAKQMSPKVSVDVAINGLEAVERFRTFRPCVVLTDVSMPEMDGVTAATEMRKIEREEGRSAAKIYAITGLGTSDPRLKLDGMWGDAALDGWLIKGQDKLSKIRDVIRTAIIDTA